MKKYYLAYDNEYVVTKEKAGELPKKYDMARKQRIDDPELCHIYSGDMPVINITEQQALEINKGELDAITLR